MNTGTSPASSRIPKHLQRAIRHAWENETYPKFRMAAVVVKGGSVLACGHNKLNTDPALVADSDRSLHKVAVHAEADALKQCGNPKGSTVYVARIGRNGKVGMARPCCRCQTQLINAGVTRAVYTISENEYGVLNLRNN